MLVKDSISINHVTGDSSLEFPHAQLLRPSGTQASPLGSAGVRLSVIPIARTGARLCVTASLVAMALMLLAVPSQAHSQEVASDPADKSKVAIVPPAVTITFNENVLGLGTKVLVTGPDGDVTEGAPTVTNNIVRQAISPDSPAGSYRVQWRATSADGHPVSGEFTFSATAAAGTRPASPSPGETVAVANTPSTASTAPAPAVGSSNSLAVVGIGAVVLAILLALSAAVGRVARNRR